MTRAALAGAALLLGGLAALVGRPVSGSGTAELADAVAQGAGRLDVVVLARWLREDRPGLRLVDLRESSDFDAFHLPGAARSTVAAATRLAAPGPIVLYADEGPVAAQTWVLLRARGQTEVYWVDDAVRAWVHGVLEPVLPSDADDVELADWPAVSELSRFFGGRPRTGGLRRDVGRLYWTRHGDNGDDDPRSRPRPLRRRGCGF